MDMDNGIIHKAVNYTKPSSHQLFEKFYCFLQNQAASSCDMKSDKIKWQRGATFFIARQRRENTPFLDHGGEKEEKQMEGREVTINVMVVGEMQQKGRKQPNHDILVSFSMIR